MDQASTRGVDTETITSLSKHDQQSKKSHRYVSQLQSKVLHVMAGFGLEDAYYVPRTLLVPPWSADEMTEKCFPQVKRWRAEYQSPQGNHTKAAEDFLYKTLPFLALCVIQDGIYWLKDFPRHDVSITLRSLFPDYERWAAEARAKAVEKQEMVEQSQVKVLGGAAQSAFHSIGGRIGSLEQTVSEIPNTVEQCVYNSVSRVIHEKVAPLIPKISAVPHVPDFPLPRAPGVRPTLDGRRPLDVPVPRPQNAFGLLQATPATPVIPRDLPKTVYELWNQHKIHELENFKIGGKSHWTPAQRIAFSKRQYLYDQICRRARNYNGENGEDRMKRAAMAMDDERGRDSVSAYLERLKRHDPSTKSRKRKSKSPT
jgi:hypothetical protein